MACPPRDTFQIGWICALPIEAAAAKEMLDESFGNLDVQDPSDPNIYTLGRIGKHHVVISCLGQYGTTSATTAANHMVRTFSKSLRIGLMVGVGGGIPSLAHDIRLGDIVISCPEGTSGGVVQYDMGKIGTGGEFHRTGSLNSPPRSLLAALNLMRTSELTDDPLYPGFIVQSTARNTRTRKTFHRPEKDRLFKSEHNHPENRKDCDDCSVDWEETRPEREDSGPRPHYGIIASGNAVIKDARTRDHLRLKTGALCFEMEAAGLMMDFPCIVIRGICDYADTHKNKQWQGYAALAAASYAKELLSYVPMGLVLQENLVVNVCNELREELGGIRDLLDQSQHRNAQHHDEQKARALADQQQKCHQAFKIGNYMEQKDINPTRVEGTCKWALQSSEYLRWVDSNHDDLLWVSADPGCGKSVLARSIIDSYLHASSLTVTICYFFFKENEEQNNLAAALCSILHQLFSQHPHLLRHAIPFWERNGKALQKETDVLWQILMEAISSDTSLKVICVFDALDECREDDQDRLIQNLKSFYQQTCQPKRDNQPTKACLAPNDTQPTKDTHLKFLVTSRPYRSIRNRFREITDFPYLNLKGEEENDQIHREIDLVVKMRIEELAKTASLPSDVKQNLEQQLLQMQHRTYLWLHLAIDDIRATYENSVSPDNEEIQIIPPSVDKAYEKILSRVPSQQASTARKIFEIIIAARRPLTTKELAMALGISIHPTSQTRVEAGIDPLRLDRKLRSLCGLFVFVNNSKVYLIHQTARDYLINEAVSSRPFPVYSCNLQSAEDQMAYICLRYLSMNELENKTFDENSCSADFLEYSAIYWGDHVRRMSSTAELETVNLVHHVYSKTADRFSAWFSIFWNDFDDSENTVPTLSGLHLAALNGHQKVLTWLISEGQVDPNVVDTTGSYPLTYASMNGHYDAVLVLLEHGAHVNAQGFYGPALHSACVGEHDQIVQVLLENGADVNARDKDSESALGLACLMGSRHAVEAMLTCGADVNAPGVFPMALFSDFCRGTVDIVQKLLNHGANADTESVDFAFYICLASYLPGREKLVKMLLEHGAKGSDSVLIGACARGAVKVVQVLLEHGAHINAYEGSITALDAACYAQNDDIMHILLEHRATTNTCCNLDATLGLACVLGKTSIVQMLLNYGATVDNKNKDDTTVLQLACSNGHGKLVEILLAHGADVNAQGGRSGMNALHFASSTEHHQIVRMLLEYGADANAQDRNGSSVLKCACLNGHDEVVRILLEHGADANAQDRNGWSVLKCACLNGHDEVVRILLEHGADANAQDRNGWSVLNCACLDGYDKIVRILLEHGADINAQDRDGWSVLMYTCLNGHDEVVRILLEHGADANAQDRNGWSVLNCACLDSYDKIVRILLEHGADINAQDRDGLSVLMYACLNEHDEIVRILLEHGADINTQYRDGWIALQWASRTGNYKILRNLLKRGAIFNPEEHLGALKSACLNGHDEIVRILLEHGADANTQDRNGSSVLKCACLKGHAEIVRILLEHGADANAQDRDGWSFLMYACLDSHDKIVRILLEHGADINAQDRDGWSVLMYACLNEHDEIIRILLEHGADINTQYRDGWSALQWASRTGNDKILRNILKREAKFNPEEHLSALKSACLNGKSKIVHILLAYETTFGAEVYLPALQAACCKGHDKILRTLLRHGAKFNTEDLYFALVSASLGGHTQIVHILLAHQPAIDGEVYQSALGAACWNGHDKAVRMLLKHGATFNPGNHFATLESACLKGYNSIVHILLTRGPVINDEDCQTALKIASFKGNHKIVQILLTYGIDSNSKDYQDTLQLACFKGHNKIVQKMLNYAVDLKSGCYQKALQTACWRGSDNIVRTFLANGFDVNERNGNLLQTACLAGHENTVQMLLEQGANVNIRSWWNISALWIARREGHETIEQILLEHGAKDDSPLGPWERRLFVLVTICVWCALLVSYLSTR